MMATASDLPPCELPSNVEAEAALLGAMMIENRVIDAVCDRVQSFHFFEPLHGRIFDAIVREYNFGRVANPVTLRPYFADDEAMKELGGPAYLATLTGSGAAVIGARDFADQVRELAKRRALVGGLNKMLEDVRDHALEYDELVGRVEQVIADAAEDTSGGAEATAADSIRDYLTAIEQGPPPGVTCGIEELDRAIGVARFGDMVVVAGRPGMGKTAVALNYGKGAAQNGHGVLFISREMSKEQLAARMAAEATYDGHSGVYFGLIESGEVARNTEAMRRVIRATREIEGLPFVIHYSAGMRVGQLKRLVRRHKRRFAARGQKLDLVIIDYLQKLTGDGKPESRTQDVAEVSRGVKDAAMENQVVALALAQLNRDVEKRGAKDRRPTLSDLAQSGQIEADADTVVFLYRGEYYLRLAEPQDDGSSERIEWERALSLCKDVIEFIAAKRRQGETGTRRGRFLGAFQAVR